MHIILHQPEIPQNTGNIGRTCVATGTSLHLIEPLGFRIDEKALKRAGMDYWDKLDVTRYTNFDKFKEQHPGAKIWMATTKAKHSYTEVEFGPDDYIMFGKESAGIPEEILVEHEETCIRIPMLPAIRSLNLSNSVAIVLYEALRQQNFASMQMEGELHRLHWKDENVSEDSQKKDSSSELAKDKKKLAFVVDPSKGQYIADTATVLGDVTLGKDVGIWHHVTIRGDRGPIIIGDGTNIQDNSVLHLDAGLVLELGKGVTVGHGAIIHGCKIGDNSLIGMGAIVMNEAVIGRDCVIGAGAVVTQGVVIPDGSLVLGCPGKVVRQVTEKDIEHNRINAESYVKEAHEAAGI